MFIPADAFRNLQDRANTNDRNSPQPISNPGYPPNTNIQSSGNQLNTNPSNNQPIGNQGYQPNTNIQSSQPLTNQGSSPNPNVPNSQPTTSQGQPNANLPNSPPISNQGYPQNSNILVQNVPSNGNQGYKSNENIQNPLLVSNQGYQPNTNFQIAQPLANLGFQPATNIQTQQPTNQPILTFRTLPEVNQVGSSNQVQQPFIVDRISAPNSNQLTVLPLNQQTILPMNQQNGFPLNQITAGQAGQLVYVQQQQPNQQSIFVPQTNQQVQQPLIVSQPPNQSFGIQNGQGSQPVKVVFTNPTLGNQVQSQNSNSVFTLIPLNGQNSNTGSILFPIQSGGSSPILISSGN